LHSRDPSQWLPKKALRHPKLRKRPPRCSYCKRWAWETGEKLTVDHLKPKSEGGTNDPKNLVLCCVSCNQLKANLGVREFFRRFKPDALTAA
jgi:5-methylcytosine-specific restriction endonuclease McrA